MGRRYDSASVVAVCVGDRLVGLVTIERLLAAELTRLADLAAAKGMSLPIFTSSNVAGGAERNTELINHYREKVHAL